MVEGGHFEDAFSGFFEDCDLDDDGEGFDDIERAKGD